tara:strand:+ start:600 stop:854 length:255 start_codon:yes stop_codon:yes gene_type:complete
MFCVVLYIDLRKTELTTLAREDERKTTIEGNVGIVYTIEGVRRRREVKPLTNVFNNSALRASRYNHFVCNANNIKNNVYNIYFG